MGNIPPEKPSKHTTEGREVKLLRMMEDATRKVAFQLHLPWKVSELYEAGQQGAAATLKEESGSNLGLALEDLLELRINQAAQEAGKTLKAQAGAESKKQPPSEQEIEAALEAFDAKQWEKLIQDMDRVDVEALLSYLRHNTDELKHRFGDRKVERTEGYAIMRETALWLKDNRSKVVPISDAYWAVVWDMQASFLNTQGRGHTPTGRSIKEAQSHRSTARRLRKEDKTINRVMEPSTHMVKEWRKRWKELPPEKFDGDFLSYLETIYFTKRYKSYLRSKGSDKQ